MKKGLSIGIEETVKLVGAVVIAGLLFSLAVWGVGRVETLGKYFTVGSPDGDIKLDDHAVGSNDVFRATVTVVNTADTTQEMWIEMTGFHPGGIRGAASQDLDRHPDQGRLQLAAGEARQGITLTEFHRKTGCAVRITLRRACGGRILCTGGVTADTVEIQLQDTVGVHPKWQGRCSG